MDNPKSPLTVYRETNAITLEALGLLLGGLHKSTILRWESFEVLIPIDKLDEIEAATGISRADLRPDIFKGFTPTASKVEAA